MELITAPIIRNDRGPAVHNLQDGLLLLLSAGRFELPDADQRDLSDKLASEQRDACTAM